MSIEDLVPTKITYPKMKPEPKRLLIEALRSGKYTQGQRALRYLDVTDNTVRHCCLGVLTEVAIEHGIELEYEDLSADTTSGKVVREYHNGGEYKSGVPPTNVCEWAGPAFKKVDDGCDSLAVNEMINMNDHTNPASFDQIADWVEENL